MVLQGPCFFTLETDLHTDEETAPQRVVVTWAGYPGTAAGQQVTGWVDATRCATTDRRQVRPWFIPRGTTRDLRTDIKQVCDTTAQR